MLQVDSHGQFVLGDLGLIGAMRARATGEEWSGGAEGIAARALKMDDFGTEFGKLCSDVRLCHQHTGSNGADALKRTESGHKRWGRWALKARYPVGQAFADFLDPVLVLENPCVVWHGSCPRDLAVPALMHGFPRTW